MSRAPDARRDSRSRQRDLRSDPVHPLQAGYHVEHALAGAVRDVRLELRSVVDQVPAAAGPPKGFLGSRVRSCKPNSSLGGVAPLPFQLPGDPPGDIRVVESERAFDTGAEHGDLVAVCAGGIDHGGQVQKRGGQSAHGRSAPQR